MRSLLTILAAIFISLAALATPISIGVGLYDWAITGVEFKFALWEGFKTWLILLGVGLFIGLPCYVASR